MKKKCFGILVTMVLSVVLGIIVVFYSSRNAFVSEMDSYICGNYGVVKSVKFDSNSLYSYPHCSIDLYVDPDCTFNQAKEIFEDLLYHFTDEFIVSLRQAKGRKSFLDVNFVRVGTDICIYTFETNDTEAFVHWKATRGNNEPYEFDRHID